MIKFFRKIRQNLLSEGKTGKYLKYAVGEIALVMIGILLALQVNNWNENLKNQKELNNIYEQIVYDLENDITELTENLNSYESIKPVFDKVFTNSRTVDLLDDGLSRLMAQSPETNLNKTGINRLRSISAKDSLSLRVIELYDLAENVLILPTEKIIREEQILLANIYRDNYSWYPEWISKKITKDNSSPELQDYFVNSQEYRHYVISNYQQIYNNYLPVLRIGIPEMKKIKSELKNKITE